MKTCSGIQKIDWKFVDITVRIYKNIIFSCIFLLVTRKVETYNVRKL